MWVRILRDRRVRPPGLPRLAIQFRAGTEVLTKRAWGEALVRDGDAEEIEPPRRPGS
jgi:hypothetical protein